MPCSMHPPRTCLLQFRNYASIAKKLNPSKPTTPKQSSKTAPTATPSRLPPKTLDLDHFLQRGRALALWRTILRGSRRIPDKKTMNDIRQFARQDFVRNKAVEDIGAIRYLISAGKTEWEGMERYIDGL